MYGTNRKWATKRLNYEQKIDYMTCTKHTTVCLDLPEFPLLPLWICPPGKCSMISGIIDGANEPLA